MLLYLLISMAKYRTKAGNLPYTIATSASAISHHGTIASVDRIILIIFGGSRRIVRVAIASPIIIRIVMIISPIVAM
jgi:hypothetical protein